MLQETGLLVLASVFEAMSGGAGGMRLKVDLNDVVQWPTTRVGAPALWIAKRLMFTVVEAKRE